MPIERPDWGSPAEGAGYGGRETSGAPVPAAPEQKHAEPAAEDSAVEADDVDAEEAAANREMLRQGTFTIEELARFRGRTVEEIDAQLKPKLSRQSVERELAAIQKMMREDRRSYDKDTKKQARYRELLERGILAHDEQGRFKAGKAGPAPAAEREESEPADQGDASRASIDAELAAIKKTMREDRRAYDKDPKMQARHLELITAREDAIEVARQTEQMQTTVQAVLDEVPDANEFEASFDSMFGSLPEHARMVIQHEFAQPPDDPARPASEADLKRFASVPEHAELVREWGKDAGRKLAIVRTRLDRMTLSGGDMEAASVWFDELPAAQAKAVLNALAGGR